MFLESPHDERTLARALSVSFLLKLLEDGGGGGMALGVVAPIRPKPLRDGRAEGVAAGHAAAAQPQTSMGAATVGAAMLAAGCAARATAKGKADLWPETSGLGAFNFRVWGLGFRGMFQGTELWMTIVTLCASGDLHGSRFNFAASGLEYLDSTRLVSATFVTRISIPQSFTKRTLNSFTS